MPSFEPFSSNRPRLRRSLQFALFVVSLLWYLLADALSNRAAQGITVRFHIEDWRPLLASFFLIFLLAIGLTLFSGLPRSAHTSLRALMGLPDRPTVRQEWGRGAALGWGMAVAAVLPMVLSGNLRTRLGFEPRLVFLLLLHLLTILFATLAVEIALRVFAFRPLIAAIGPAWATVLMILLIAGSHATDPDSIWISIAVTIIATLLFSLGWLRTHGLWVSWGVHFAWNAAIALLFGLPVRGIDRLATVVQSWTIGPVWLTGYTFGPEGALLTALILLAGIVVLIRMTGDYSWSYTRPEIVSAGYAVDPPPPAEHVAMENATAQRPAPLVQILPTTPQSRSADDPEL